MTLVLVENKNKERNYFLTLDETLELIRKHKRRGVNPCRLDEHLGSIRNQLDHFREYPEELDPRIRKYLEFFLSIHEDIKSRARRKKKGIPYIANSVIDAGFIERLPELKEGKEREAPVIEDADILWLYNLFNPLEIEDNPIEGFSYKGNRSAVRCFGKGTNYNSQIALYVEYLTDSYKGERGWFPISSMFGYRLFK